MIFAGEARLDGGEEETRWLVTCSDGRRELAQVRCVVECERLRARRLTCIRMIKMEGWVGS